MTATPRRNILISSAGRRVALMRCFADAIKELGLDSEVFAADVQHASAAYQLATRSFQVPRCDDPAFAGAMVDLCDHWDIGLVVPTIDTELPMWAALAPGLRDRGTIAAVSSPHAIDIAADKHQTNAFLRVNGLPATEQLTREQALAEGQDAFPLIVKPRRGSSSHGLRLVHAPHALDPVADTDVIERVAPGVEYTIDVLVGCDGTALAAVPRRRIEVRSGEVSKAVVELNDDLMALGVAVCEALPGAYGTLNVQVMWDHATAGAAVIEINARFGGGFPLTDAAGGHYARWMLEELHGLPSTVTGARWQDGLAMLRYDEAVFAPRHEVGW